MERKSGNWGGGGTQKNVYLGSDSYTGVGVGRRCVKCRRKEEYDYRV
jgi:hypothetical protein